MDNIGWIIALIISATHLIGLFSATHAILNARTASGAIAWSITLTTFPYLAVPIYWIISREKFYGYAKLLRTHTLAHNRHRDVETFLRRLEEYRDVSGASLADTERAVLEKLAHLPFTRNNKVELLIDGKETFDTLFQTIDEAQEYILILFYIIADDEIGNLLKERLLAAADRGIEIHVLYDELGCIGFLSQNYIEECKQHGIEIHPFYTTRGYFNKFQYNFRNHRKIAIVDGKKALVGGVNVHDDSTGASLFYGNWRDTHVLAEGPVVQNIQLVWAEDYFWATSSLPRLNWEPSPAANSDREALYVPTGPASHLPSGLLFFTHCINQASERLWIASPYFIPDSSVINALILAALRGVDVRIILPERYDLLIMYLAAFSYFPEIENSGVRVFRYRAGYPHQKAMLIDDRMSWIGSSNIDNRSMRLNFEGNLVVRDAEFCSEVESMLNKDLARSIEVGPEDYHGRGLLFKLGVKVARLFSPIL